MHVATLCPVTVDRDPLIEHETLSLPKIVAVVDLFEVAQDAALQLVDLVEAELHHECRRFLAADAARAKHREFSVRVVFGQFLRVRGKIAKTVGLRVYGVLKRTHLVFVAVAGIDDQRVRIVEQRIPLLDADVPAGRFVRANVGTAECHDFFLDLDPHASEWRGVGLGPAALERLAQLEACFNPVEDSLDVLARAGQRAVNALFRDEDRTEQFSAIALGLQAATQGCRISDVGESIEGNDVHRRSKPGPENVRESMLWRISSPSTSRASSPIRLMPSPNSRKPASLRRITPRSRRVRMKSWNSALSKKSGECNP